MNCKSVSGLVKQSLLVLSVAFLLATTTVTEAKTRNTIPGNKRADTSKMDFVSTKDVKRILIRLINRKAAGNSKSAASIPVACSCSPAPNELGGFGGCFRDCLQSWGISYSSLITCGGVCGLAATGNPVAIGVCAGCLGTGEWIVAGCILYCVSPGKGYGYLEEVRLRGPRPPGTHQAKTKLKPATAS
jgi:hypothetical protein